MHAMLKILIADDHELLRQHLKQILLEEFPLCLIEEVEDGRELLEKALSDRWDLIISDISMPVMNGLEALRRIRVHFPSLPVLLLSIYCDEQYASTALKAGASGYLCKERAQDELISTIQQIIV
jgi:two-component system, NarL family, invasion response regulator UvrY